MVRRCPYNGMEVDAAPCEPRPSTARIRLAFRSHSAVIAVAMAVLWLAFQRLAPWRREKAKSREEIDVMENGHTGDLRSILSAALRRLRLRPAGWPRGGDAIGRLSLSMLHQGGGRGAATTSVSDATGVRSAAGGALRIADSGTDRPGLWRGPLRASASPSRGDRTPARSLGGGLTT